MIDTTELACRLCGKELQAENSVPPDARMCECVNCGRYVIDFLGERELTADAEKLFRAACLVRETHVRQPQSFIGIFSKRNHPAWSSGIPFTERWEIGELLARWPSATEMIDRALVNLSAFVDHPYSPLVIKFGEDEHLLFCRQQEAIRMTRHMEAMGLIVVSTVSSGGIHIEIAPHGWLRIDELAKTPKRSSESDQAFVAMWFDSGTDAIFRQGIEPGIRDAGYIPNRIDLCQHNNKICDQIVAEIRRSRFVVADFTGQRGGVYFEAGFALGLGTPVIWLVRKDEIDGVHFDTRQFNHILYESAEDLRKQLTDRINATIH